MLPFQTRHFAFWLAAWLVTFIAPLVSAGERESRATLFARLERALTQVPKGYMPVYALPMHAQGDASPYEWSVEIVLGKGEEYAFVFEHVGYKPGQSFSLVGAGRRTLFSGDLSLSSPEGEARGGASLFYRCKHSGFHRVEVEGGEGLGYLLICVRREACPVEFGELKARLPNLARLLASRTPDHEPPPRPALYPKSYNTTALLIVACALVSLWTWAWWRSRH